MSKPSTGEIFELICAEAPKGASELTAKDNLADRGIDSLLAVTIIVSAIERFGLDGASLNPTAPPPVTVADLIDLIQGLSASPAA